MHLRLAICPSEKGWDWYVCEGFQCILYHQAEALETLGVSPELKVSDVCLDVSCCRLKSGTRVDPPLTLSLEVYLEVCI